VPVIATADGGMIEKVL